MATAFEVSPAQAPLRLPTADRLHHEHPAAKRRRISVEEVENHLWAANLSQPALSLLYGPRKEESDMLQEAFHKRERTEPHEIAHAKRRRLYVNALAPSVARSALPAMVEDTQTGSKLFCIIEPYCHSGGGGNLVLHDGSRCRQVHLPDPREKIASCTDFAPSSQGLLIAKIPSLWQPTVNLPNGHSVTVAEMSIDWQGTVRLLSREGKLLAEVPATRRIEDASCADVVKIYLHGVRELPRERDEQLLGAMLFNR